jgi:hypothetical protein
MLCRPLLLFAAAASAVACAERTVPTPQNGSDAITGSCTDCAPSIRRSAILGGRGPGVGPLGRIEAGPNGHYYVAHVHAPAEIGVHRRDGQYAGTIGQAGDGPGEFRHIMGMAVRGDSLHVFDSRHARQTVFALSDSAVRTRILMPGILRGWPLPGGGAVVHSACYGYMQECSADPFHVFDNTSRVRSFGAQPEVLRPGGRTWSAVTADEAGIWAARSGRYRIYRWNYDGMLLDSVVRHADWFPDHDVTPYRRGVRPGPAVRDVRQDDQDRLWILIRIADDRWADQFRDSPDPDTSFNGSMESYWDTFLEVIDLRARRVVAQARYDEFISRISSDMKLVAEREASNGEPYIELWEATLRGR